NVNTVVGAMQADIALAGPLAQESYSATIRKLVDELRQMTAYRNDARKELEAQHDQYLKLLQKVYQPGVAEWETAAKQAQSELATKIRSADEQLGQKDKDISQRDEAYKALQVKSVEESEALEKQNKTKDKKNKDLENANRLLNEKLENVQKTSWERPSGII